MDYLLIFLLILGIIFVLSSIYNIGKSAGREEANSEKSIEILNYNGKDILLINQEYFSMEQAEQIGEAIKRENPIIYKPSRNV